MRRAKRRREGKQKGTKEGQAATRQRQRDNRATRGEHTERRTGGEEEERIRERQNDDARSITGDRLAASANEHVKTDNKKAIQEHRRRGPTSGQGSPVPDSGQFLFPTRELRTTGGQGVQGEDIGLWGCFLELSFQCLTARHVYMLAGCHVAMLRYGLLACRLASRTLSWCHAIQNSVIWTAAEGQQGDNKGTTGGQEEDNKRRRRGQEEEKRKDKKRTTGGQGPETGWQPQPSWWQQEDNRRSRTRQKEDKKRATGGQGEGTEGTKEYNKRQGLETGDGLAAAPTRRGQQVDKRRTTNRRT